MGKFDDKIAQQKKEIESRYSTPVSIISFQWPMGYAVMLESRFNRLSKRDKNKLLAPLSK